MPRSIPSPTAPANLTPSRLRRVGYRVGWGFALALGLAPAAWAEPPAAPPEPEPLRHSLSCNIPLTTLTETLVRDLPSYANRVAQRSSGTLGNRRRPTYMIVASQPDSDPLPLPAGSDTATPADDSLQQVFITTLERQYERPTLGAERSQDNQHYHWLFLAENNDGWYLAFAYSSFGHEDPDAPITPPRDSTIGILGRAVTLWMRDCRAGAIAAD